MGIFNELYVMNTAMDQSYSESDVSLSPSQILDRLQVLRQLQLLQRGKLQKQRLEYQETDETSSNLTEIVSQFSSSTSYHTFRSLLQSSSNISSEGTPRENGTSSAANIKEHDLIEGVTALNLSQESEFIIGSSFSSRSKVSVPSRTENNESSPIKAIQDTSHSKKQIALDDMPILTPKQDFETLVLEKLKNEKVPKTKSPIKDSKFPTQRKKPFLKRGEGMSRFGVKKNDLVIQNTKSLPWRQKSLDKRVNHTPKKIQNNKKGKVQILVKESAKSLPRKSENNNVAIDNKDNLSKVKLDVKDNKKDDNKQIGESTEIKKNEETCTKPLPILKYPTGKHPLRGTRGKTWAAVLTKEQDDFLKQLKQSDYYKNFTSPAKSIISDTSCDENLYRLHQEKERTEQIMFDLLESKASRESFNLENSFINKFLRRNLECSGESTPLIMQRCLANNPELLHLGPDFKKTRTESHHSECSSEYTDCSETSSETSCSTCKAAEETDCTTSPKSKQKVSKNKEKQQTNDKPKRKESPTEKEQCHDDTVTERDIMKANMEEMNAKLIATSDLLKDRLRELEEEIETFRKENANLAKMREEIDLERQKFYEEKNTFEQKFNEEKILAEYYLAEEKDKLNKQKQMYEKYVREIRGRLNKKEKDEVVNLKKEIQDLKEEIRIKDAKSTSLIARLRNQLKIMEKEKEKLQQEVEKLKKENRRIQHSNEITRRLTNVKYLEEINKKLSNMSKKTQSDMDLDNNVKYKAYEIERQSRSRKKVKPDENVPRPRAKSVPNLNVTSRYAKYFSQRDAVSHMDQNNSFIDDYHIGREDEEIEIPKLQSYSSEESSGDEESPSDENNLEKLYMERFQTASSVDNEGEKISSIEKHNDNVRTNPDPFFYRRPNESQPSKINTEVPLSSINNNTKRTISPISILSNRSGGHLSSKEKASNSAESIHSPRTSRSPISILSNSTSYRPVTVLNQGIYRERDKLMNVSPEPSTQPNRISHSKTSLTPNEIKKPDGSKELRFPNGNVKFISADGKYSRFVYYNGDVKENFYSEGRIKYFYAETKTYHTTHADGLEILEFPDGQVEKRYKDGSSEIRLPNGSVRYHDPKNEHIREEWRFPDGTSLTISANGDQRIVFPNGQVEVHAKDHKRREFPDGTVKLVYTDGTSETRYASGRVRIKDKHGNLIMDSAPG